MVQSLIDNLKSLVRNKIYIPHPWRHPCDMGSIKEENASASHKNSTDQRQETDCRILMRSHCADVLDLLQWEGWNKFFTLWRDEEDQSHVNTRTRQKRLFEPKEKEGKDNKTQTVHCKLNSKAKLGPLRTTFSLMCYVSLKCHHGISTSVHTTRSKHLLATMRAVCTYVNRQGIKVLFSCFYLVL